MNIEEAIIDKVTEIEARTFNEYCQDERSIGILGGLGGIPLFYLALYEKFQKEEYLKKLEYVLDKVLDSINQDNWGQSFCNGLSGTGFMINFLRQKEYLDDDIEPLLQDFDEIILTVSRNTIQRDKDYDYLHGSLGMIYYLLERVNKNTSLRKPVEELCEAVIELVRKELQGHETSMAAVHDGHSVRHLNMGMAHGLLSVLIIISRYYKFSGNSSQNAFSLIRQILNTYATYRARNAESISLYPTIVSDSFSEIIINDPFVKFDTPLGWCYGDGCISLSFLEVSKVMNDHSIYKNARYAIDYTLNRTSPQQASIKDACLCHGTAMLAHIYKRWYNHTGEKVFFNAYTNWIHETIRIGDNNDGIGGYKRFYGEDGYKNVFPLLDGSCGTALVLLDYLAEDKYTIDWDRLFLLN